MAVFGTVVGDVVTFQKRIRFFGQRKSDETRNVIKKTLDFLEGKVLW